jgi:integrase
VDAPSVTVAQAQDMKEAVRRLKPLGTPVHVVAGEYADVVQQLAGSGTLRQAVDFFLHNSIRPDMQRTVPQVFDEFLASKRANGCSRVYVEDCLWRLRRFAQDFQVPISHVCTRDIEQWLCKLSTSLVTRNDFRRLIITLFNFARRRGHLPRDRETEARWLEKPKIKSKPIQIFTPQELNELLAVAEGQPLLAIVIGAFTGIRSAEMLRLRWENFNWEESVIELGCDQTKTASRRLVPILEPLAAWIRPFVRPEGSVLGYSLPVCLAEAFATTAKKADKARKERDPDADGFRWKANGLRHSYLCMNGYFAFHCKKHINQSSVAGTQLAENVPFRLPPAKEQQRINAKLRRLLDSERKLRQQLSSRLLAQRFAHFVRWNFLTPLARLAKT